MKPEGLLPCSKWSATGAYPEPDESTPHRKKIFPFNYGPPPPIYVYIIKSHLLSSSSLLKCCMHLYSHCRDSSDCIALGYGLDDRGSRVRFPAGMGIFLFATASTRALGLTQPPNQWVSRPLFLGIKRPGYKADHSPLSSTEVKE
jgi:hypothetical protein